MKLNIENASAIRDPSMKPWLLDELVRNLKEMRDRSNAGDMAAAVAEFFEVFRFNDGKGIAFAPFQENKNQSESDKLYKIQICGQLDDGTEHTIELSGKLIHLKILDEMLKNLRRQIDHMTSGHNR